MIMETDANNLHIIAQNIYKEWNQCKIIFVAGLWFPHVIIKLLSLQKRIDIILLRERKV